MKKILRAGVLFMLCAAMLAGCGEKYEEDDSKERDRDNEEVEETEDKFKDFSNTDDISYVMIYNPKIYDERKTRNELLNTGDFEDYVEAIINKADGLEEIPEILPYQGSDILKDFPLDEVDLSGSRSGTYAMPYSVGDTHGFYCGQEKREIKEFVCRYVGDNCNIWTLDNSVSSRDIENLGKEFDKNVYEKVVDMFGEPRYADEGGKINLLLYQFEASYLGFFHPLDLFATGEVSPAEIAHYGINTDHAILNINSMHIENEDVMYSTMAHELQHLICFTDYFYTAAYGGINMRTWLNEAMSGYVEEQLYPGVKDMEGHYEALARSNRIRHGQSMYNFETSVTYSNFDIGVYGSVYLFSEYLANLADGDVFLNIHNYWRESGSRKLDEAEAIVNSVPEKTYKKIDKSIDFDDKFDFNSEEEEWLSKLTLNFYLSLLNFDKNDPKAYKNVKSQTLLYDEVNPAEIEGGGRVIVALKDGKFEIPEDADEGFVYIGLNEDFEVITDYIIE